MYTRDEPWICHASWKKAFCIHENEAYYMGKRPIIQMKQRPMALSITKLPMLRHGFMVPLVSRALTTYVKTVPIPYLKTLSMMDLERVPMMDLETVPIVDDVFENGAYHVFEHGTLRENGVCGGFENSVRHVFENGAHCI